MNPLAINLRHLAKRDLELVGSLAAAEMDLEGLDPLIDSTGRVFYQLTVAKMQDSLHVTGHWAFGITCQCVRCLKSFRLELGCPALLLELPLSGEEALAIEGDFVDLTPHLREEIVLAFPQHPLCGPGCRGLDFPAPQGNELQPGSESAETSSAWAVLDKLKLND